MNTPPSRAVVASLAHGLAHEVAALMDARLQLGAALSEVGLAQLDRMIEQRKMRVQALGAQVAGHA